MLDPLSFGGTIGAFWDVYGEQKERLESYPNKFKLYLLSYVFNLQAERKDTDDKDDSDEV